MGNFINNTKTDDRQQKQNQPVITNVKTDVPKKTSLFKQVSSEELKKRRIDVYPYLM